MYVCVVDMGGTLSRLVVYSQDGQKCVLTLLAVLHQPVCKIVCVQLHVSGGAH